MIELNDISNFQTIGPRVLVKLNGHIREEITTDGGLRLFITNIGEEAKFKNSAKTGVVVSCGTQVPYKAWAEQKGGFLWWTDIEISKGDMVSFSYKALSDEYELNDNLGEGESLIRCNGEYYGLIHYGHLFTCNDRALNGWVIGTHPSREKYSELDVSEGFDEGKIVVSMDGSPARYKQKGNGFEVKKGSIVEFHGPAIPLDSELFSNLVAVQQKNVYNVIV